MNIKLNCAMGEGFGTYSMGYDEKIMPYIQMANLACGFHASDPVTMHKSVKLCKEHNIQIGCHPCSNSSRWTTYFIRLLAKLMN